MGMKAMRGRAFGLAARFGHLGEQKGQESIGHFAG